MTNWYVSVAISAMPWIVAILGWIYANNAANKRELRKELRADIDDINELVKDINKLIIDHHNNGNGIDINISRVAIHAKLQTLLIKTERLIVQCSNNNQIIEPNFCKKYLADYFDFASGDHLEPSKNLTKFEIAELNFEVHMHGIALDNSLDSLFRARFPVK